MNIRSNYEEIGLLETVKLIEKYMDDPKLTAECAEYLPAIRGGLSDRLSALADGIRKCGKENCCF